MKIISVVGARPNFMKIAPFMRAIAAFNQIKPVSKRIEHLLVHTGQHYDSRMSGTFFDELAIPEADTFEKILRSEKPDWVVVVGDVNATLACSVTAKKEWVKVCHIEAGLRSGDITMPEEVNRLVTDRLSDLLLTPDHISSENLRKEGTPESRIVLVGNIMIDTLEANRDKAAGLKIEEIIAGNLAKDFHLKTANPADEHFALMTLHRPSNVDDETVFRPILHFLMDEVAADLTLIWPVHPRARKQMEEFGLYHEVSSHPNIVLLDPLGYHDMLRLNMGARIMLTDSGGLQEECTILGTPCLTLRWNTERPVTLKEYGDTALTKKRTPFRPPLWDGKTAERCLEAIIKAS